MPWVPLLQKMPAKLLPKGLAALQGSWVHLFRQDPLITLVPLHSSVFPSPRSDHLMKGQVLGQLPQWPGCLTHPGRHCGHQGENACDRHASQRPSETPEQHP